jgi:hypothetical protein
MAAKLHPPRRDQKHLLLADSHARDVSVAAAYKRSRARVTRTCSNTGTGSKAVGTVEAKITSSKKAGGRQVKASKDEPQYLVKSEKSGGTAVHKPGALKKKG